MAIDLKDRLKLSDFKDKVIFWDIDGTICPLRFNGKSGITYEDGKMAPHFEEFTNKSRESPRL